MNTKRYEELYKLAKEQFASEQARFTRLETKATQYLAVLTFLIGLSVPLGTAAVKAHLPPSSFVSWLMLNLLVVIFVGLVIVWFLAFSVIKISATRACPLNEEVIRFYNDNSDVDVFYGMAKAFASAWKENLEINEAKGRLLTRAHQGIRVLVCLIATFGALSFFRAWNVQSKPTPPTAMSETNQSPNASTPLPPQSPPPTTQDPRPVVSEKPSENVEPPKFILMANSRDFDSETLPPLLENE